MAAGDLEASIKVTDQFSGSFAKFNTALGESGRRAGDAFGGFQRLTTGAAGLSGALLTLGGPLAAVGGALQAFNLARQAAENERLAKSYEALAASANVNGREVVAKIKEIADGTIDESEAIKLANLGILRGGQQLASQLPQIFEAARTFSKATGQDVAQVFQSIIEGVSSGQERMLRASNIVVDYDDAQKKLADSIGKTVAQLTDQQKKQALLNAVTEKARATQEALGGTSEDNLDVFDRFSVQLKELGDVAGKVLLPALIPILKLVGALLQPVAALADAISATMDAASKSDTLKAFGDAANFVLAPLGFLTMAFSKTAEAVRNVVEQSRQAAVNLKAGMNVQNFSSVDEARQQLEDLGFQAAEAAQQVKDFQRLSTDRSGGSDSVKQLAAAEGRLSVIKKEQLATQKQLDILLKGERAAKAAESAKNTQADFDKMLKAQKEQLADAEKLAAIDDADAEIVGRKADEHTGVMNLLREQLSILVSMANVESLTDEQKKQRLAAIRDLEVGIAKGEATTATSTRERTNAINEANAALTKSITSTSELIGATVELSDAMDAYQKATTEAQKTNAMADIIAKAEKVGKALFNTMKSIATGEDNAVGKALVGGAQSTIKKIGSDMSKTFGPIAGEIAGFASGLIGGLFDFIFGSAQRQIDALNNRVSEALARVQAGAAAANRELGAQTGNIADLERLKANIAQKEARSGSSKVRAEAAKKTAEIEKEIVSLQEQQIDNALTLVDKQRQLGRASYDDQIRTAEAQLAFARSSNLGLNKILDLEIKIRDLKQQQADEQRRLNQELIAGQMATYDFLTAIEEEGFRTDQQKIDQLKRIIDQAQTLEDQRRLRLQIRELASKAESPSFELAKTVTSTNIERPVVNNNQYNITIDLARAIVIRGLDELVSTQIAPQMFKLLDERDRRLGARQ